MGVCRLWCAAAEGRHGEEAHCIIARFVLVFGRFWSFFKFFFFLVCLKFVLRDEAKDKVVRWNCEGGVCLKVVLRDDAKDKMVR